jgi:hypothetical protein
VRCVEGRAPAFPGRTGTMRILHDLSVFIGMATLTISLTFMACAKKAEDLAQDLGAIPEGCGTAGARLEAVIDGASFCANAQVNATGDGSSVIVTGIALDGSTLVLQIDQPIIGTHAITEAMNGLLWMQTGTTFTVAPGTQGTLTIQAHDPVVRTLQATFAAPLFNEMNGQSKQVEGQVEVTYTTEG